MHSPMKSTHLLFHLFSQPILCDSSPYCRPFSFLAFPFIPWYNDIFVYFPTEPTLPSYFHPGRFCRNVSSSLCPIMHAFFRSLLRSVPPFHCSLFPSSLPVQPSPISSLCSFFPPLTPCLFLLGDHFLPLSRPLNVCLALMHTFSR